MSKNFEGILLGPHTRNLACQTLSGWLSLSPSERKQSMEPLFYRAALQLLLLTVFDQDLSPTVGRIKRLPSSFGLYVEMVWSRISKQLPPLSPSCTFSHLLLPNVDVSALDEWYISIVLPRQKEISVLHILRLSLAGAIESMILLDRLCYLAENLNICFVGERPCVPLDTQSWKINFNELDQSDAKVKEEKVSLYLIPIFDVSLSARNMAICGVKHETKIS